MASRPVKLMGEMMQIGFREGVKTKGDPMILESIYFIWECPYQGKLGVWHHHNPVACCFQVHEDTCIFLFRWLGTCDPNVGFIEMIGAYLYRKDRGEATRLRSR